MCVRKLLLLTINFTLYETIEINKISIEFGFVFSLHARVQEFALLTKHSSLAKFIRFYISIVLFTSFSISFSFSNDFHHMHRNRGKDGPKPFEFFTLNYRSLDPKTQWDIVKNPTHVYLFLLEVWWFWTIVWRFTVWCLITHTETHQPKKNYADVEWGRKHKVFRKRKRFKFCSPTANPFTYIFKRHFFSKFQSIEFREGRLEVCASRCKGNIKQKKQLEERYWAIDEHWLWLERNYYFGWTILWSPFRFSAACWCLHLNRCNDSKSNNWNWEKGHSADSKTFRCKGSTFWPQTIYLF